MLLRGKSNDRDSSWLEKSDRFPSQFTLKCVDLDCWCWSRRGRRRPMFRAFGVRGCLTRERRFSYYEGSGLREKRAGRKSECNLQTVIMFLLAVNACGFLLSRSASESLKVFRKHDVYTREII